MALPASGAISMAQIQSEFGGSNPIGLNEYYGAADGIATSGTIDMNNFHGKASVPVVTYIGNRNGTNSWPTTNIGAKQGGGYRAVVYCFPNMNKGPYNRAPSVSIVARSGGSNGQTLTDFVGYGKINGGWWEEYAVSCAWVPDDCTSVSMSMNWGANHGRTYYMWVVDKLQTNTASYTKGAGGGKTIATQPNDVIIWGCSGGGYRNMSWEGNASHPNSITAPNQANSYCRGSSESFICVDSSTSVGGAYNEHGFLRLR